MALQRSKPKDGKAAKDSRVMTPSMSDIESAVEFAVKATSIWHMSGIGALHDAFELPVKFKGGKDRPVVVGFRRRAVYGPRAMRLEGREMVDATSRIVEASLRKLYSQWDAKTRKHYRAVSELKVVIPARFQLSKADSVLTGCLAEMFGIDPNSTKNLIPGTIDPDDYSTSVDDMEPVQSAKQQVDVVHLLKECQNILASVSTLRPEALTVAMDLVVRLLSKIPASEYSSVLNGESFSTEQRLAIAEFVGEEAQRMVVDLQKIGLSLRTIGEAIGVSHATVKKYADGDTEQPRLGVLEKLSELYEEHGEAVELQKQQSHRA